MLRLLLALLRQALYIRERSELKLLSLREIYLLLEITGSRCRVTCRQIPFRQVRCADFIPTVSVLLSMHINHFLRLLLLGKTCPRRVACQAFKSFVARNAGIEMHLALGARQDFGDLEHH